MMTFQIIEFVFYPDLHPVRNFLLCCSELSSDPSLTNFSWGGKTMIKQIPINVGLGGTLDSTQSIPNDHFKCGNQTFSYVILPVISLN